MRLGDIFPAAADQKSEDIEVSALAFDDRDVVPGTVFFCVRGLTRDGHEFAEQAVASGAAALVVDHALNLGCPEIVVGDVRAAMAPAAARFAGDPTAELKMVGITGTSGKTTTAYLAAALLSPEPGGAGCGIVGTVATRIGGVDRDAIRTTPEAIALQQTFRAMLASGDTSCVMEVSSHALALQRADAIHWDVAAFTNLGHDHLDFHADVEDYFQAKRKLFVDAAAEGASLITSADDQYGRRLSADFPAATTVGIDVPADLHATDLLQRVTSTEFSLDGTRFTVPLPGRFNVLNALVAIAIARALGHADDQIAARLAAAGGVPGRFEPVDAGQDFGVIVDYAHKPEAVGQALSAARALAGTPRDLRARRRW
jgi:UDP-N-acetylmuramoyl-L-alanyl-D-glutamate--2,6-diaminopimelate ligase